MIQIRTIWAGLTFVAINVNDFGEITTALGITRGHAEHRLINKVS